MFILTSESQFDNAKKKLKSMSVKPRCKIVHFGQYKVQGSRGNWYDVSCKRNPVTGEKMISCACETKRGIACYHSLVAVSIHIVLAEQLQAVRLPDNVLAFTPKTAETPRIASCAANKPIQVGGYRI